MKGYDYSQPGGYFVTLVAKDGKSIFEKVEGSRISLNDIGELLKACWLNIPKHFNNTRLDAFVLMPNHLQEIITPEGSAGRGEASSLINSAVPTPFPVDASSPRSKDQE